MPDKTFFEVMIESVEPEQSFIQVFWTSATHPGEAIEKVLRACATVGIKNAIASELDNFDFKSLPASTIYDKKLDVFYSKGRTYFPTEKTFTAPFGIIKSFSNGKYDYDLIREGFMKERAEAGSMKSRLWWRGIGYSMRLSNWSSDSHQSRCSG